MPNRLTRITTRGGDKGESSLADGSRHSKFAPQFGALGDIDELRARLGADLAIACFSGFREAVVLLELPYRFRGRGSEYIRHVCF